MKNKIPGLLLLVVLIINACAPVAAPTKEDVAPPPIEEPLAAQTEPALQPELPVATSWRAVRDPRYGFGFAIPCWWLTNPISTDGALYTVKNYDEAYFNAHSQKGSWDWPNGTLKLDIVTMEGIDPAKRDADAYMEFVDPTMTGLVSAEEHQIGTNTATVLTLSNLVNTNDSNTQVFIYRLSPSALLMVVPIPQTIANTPDFKTLLASIVLAPDQQVVLPASTPAPALIEASCAS